MAYHRLERCEVAFVHNKVGAVEERCHGAAEKQRADNAVSHKHPLERACAENVAKLVLKLVAHSLEHEGEQDDHPQPVGTAEAGAVEQRERGEECSAKGYERGERYLPLAPRAVHDNAALFITMSKAEHHRVGSLNKHKENEEGTEQRDDEPPVMLQKYVGHFFLL